MEEGKGLLRGEDSESEGDVEEAQPSVSIARRRLRYQVLLHLVLVLSIAVNVLQALHHTTFVERLTIFPELKRLQQVVKNEHPEHGETFSAFQGPPSTLTAHAWNTLLQPFYFNATENEVSAGGLSPNVSVRVKDGGFLASLGVYHELHCLNQLRNFIYTHTGPPSFAENDMAYHGHLDHCIEVLRLSVMCAADLSFYTFTWPKEENFTFLDAHSKSPRKCVDWEQIQDWSTGRKISLTPTVLYPDEEESSE
ncbi:hypothetical protein BDV96DRAFT_642282 [Lophiotrema nucula]|uniref:Tat pathway signal sequence n=1 Tax=Lophiotrema nucula TaxID=690887 RepID=A0A6A5ZJ08_9PLEO|nr:hypothetical protein BDV96DRAFT_642282 [Lophiotrema nucula]